MKIKTKQITVTAIMLAICLVSQFFKNLSVYITGPIINAALIHLSHHFLSQEVLLWRLSLRCFHVS